MKYIFIDGGAHYGESVDLFREIEPDADKYEIHSFEPNPAYWEALEKRGVILHKEALWNKDGEVDFFLGRNDGTGSTLLRKKVSGKVDYNHPVKTKSVRLSSWIMNNFSKEDYIYLKLDVEGAEYAILDDLIDTGAVEYVDYLCGELHLTGPEGRIRSLPEAENKRILARLEKCGIQFNDWHNNFNNM